MSLTEELITFSVQTQYESLPMSVRHAASRCVLDHLGCVFGGMQTHLGRITADLVSRDGGAHGETSSLGESGDMHIADDKRES